METLTEKQIANRAYYAKNSERITAKKRAQYTTSKPEKTVKTKKPKAKPITINPGWQNAKPTVEKISAENALKLKTRRRIEDLKIAKELGIDASDLEREDSRT